MTDRKALFAHADALEALARWSAATGFMFTPRQHRLIMGLFDEAIDAPAPGPARATEGPTEEASR